MPALQPTRRTGGAAGTLTWTVTASSYNASCLVFQLLVNALLLSLRYNSSEGAAPVFTQSVWRGNAFEDAAVGTSVLRIEATDADGDTVDYSMWGGQNHNHFSVAYSTGVISISRPLDREAIPSYSLTVSASDFVHFVQASVIITVQDVNDNSPSCDFATILVTLSEAAKFGTRVTSVNCTDADSGLNGQLSYRISSGNAHDVFTIHNASGIVETAKTLDYELTTLHRLVVTVTDMAPTTSLQTNVTLLIPIRPVNEYTPVFRSSFYETSVRTDLQQGSNVLQVSAYDLDEGPGGAVTYTLMNNISHFTVNNSSGNVTSFSALRYDCLVSQNNVFRLVVKAEDDGNPSKSSLANVTVTVTQSNDYAPVCSPVAYATSVPESLQLNSIILTLMCSDRDGGALMYEIKDGDSLNVFNLSESGELITEKPLDYEKNDSYDLLISVTERCVSTAKSTTASVTVQVTGVNEYRPSFSAREYNVSVREDTTVGTAILRLNATDEDRGNDGVINYWIGQRTPTSTAFLVDRISGMLILARSLDRETSDVHLLMVEVTDSSRASDRMTGSAVVNIAVDDVNDNSPSCDFATILVTLSEAAEVGTRVTSVNCTDADSGPNGQLSYRISSGNAHDAFTIHNASGIVETAKTLDYELTTLHRLVVTVTDMAPTTSLQTNVTLLIPIRPVNEYTPVFRSSFYETSVRTDLQQGSNVLQVSAYDLDEGPGGAVTYTLMDNISHFTVNKSSGNVTLLRALRYNCLVSQNNVFRFVVKAEDDGNPSKSSLANVTVTVTKSNDYAPVCSPVAYATSVPESLQPNSTVLTLICSDRDGDALMYEIRDGDTLDVFNITESGELVTEKTLDYEKNDSYDLLISVTEKCVSTPKSVTASVTVQVTGVNEHPPSFSAREYNVSVREDTTVGTAILRLNATDEDRGNDGVINYWIGQRTPTSTAFLVDRISGMLILARSLDRETSDVHLLIVEATDSSRATDRMTGSTVVNIAVDDVNDNTPVCRQSVVVTTVDDSAPVGAAVARLSCSDSDTEARGRLSYKIDDSAATDLFTVTLEGDIKTKRSLARPLLSSLFSFVVIVSDHGDPRLVSNVSVVVHVTRTKPYTSSPVFHSSNYITSLYENATIGTTVTTVYAVGNATSASAKCVYSVVRSDADTVLAVDPMSGDVVLTNTLDRETKDSYTLVVEVGATNNRGRKVAGRTDIATVTVNVADVNDNAPSCGKLVVTVDVPEDAPLYTTIAQLDCVDADEGKNGDLTYEIIDSRNEKNFPIFVTSDGDIHINETLDYESIQSYSFTISVCDDGMPSNQINVSVVIVVDAINESPPAFQSALNISVDEDAYVGTVIAHIRATDSDKGTDGQITYTITSHSNSIPFSIEQNTGRVLLIQTLDRETVEIYDVTVTAMDGGNPPGVAHTSMRLTVLDANDNSPTCRRATVIISLSEVKNGSEAARLKCSDPDEGKDGQLLYTITTTRDGIPFSIDQHGLIHVTNKTTDNGFGVYTFLVDVSDRGALQRTTTVTVIVSTTGTRNEHTPWSYPYFERLVSSVSIAENITIGSILISLNCTVPSGNAPTLNITAGDESRRFAATSSSGDVKVARAIDYEASVRYLLTVACYDSADKSKFVSSLIDIKVNDVNEFIPTFSQNQMTASVLEDAKAGTSILTVSAKDEDGDASIQYSIERAEPDNHPFILDALNGRITLLGRLDREEVSAYDLNVSASDSVYTVYAMVRIKVTDSNDNAPQCRSLLHVVSLNRMQTVNTVVDRLNCSDRDAGANGFLSYELRGEWSHVFTINRTNGELKLMQQISSAEKVSETRLTVLVSDHGSPRSLNETVEVVVNFLETNNYAPEFPTPALLVFNVNESERLGYRVGRIIAHDRDGNSNIQYRILRAARSAPFFLDRSTGNLYLIHRLDREMVDSYVLTIEAVDGGFPIGKTSTTNVTVNVRDINDNAPSCSPSVYGNVVSRETSSGTILAKLNCSDVDLGANGVVQYRMLSDINNFYVNSSGYVILRDTRLDDSRSELLQLPIAVSDKGTVSLSTSVVVVLRVLEEDRHGHDKTSSEPSLVKPADKIESEWVTNSVEVQFVDYDWKQWITSGRSIAKALFALAATVYCSESSRLCFVMKPTSNKQQNDELVVFKDSHVIIVQAKEIKISGRHQLVVSLYISLPDDVQAVPGTPTTTVVQQATAKNIIDYAKSSLQARKLTIGDVRTASFVFSTEPASEMTDEMTSNFAGWEIKAISCVPPGLMLILAVTLLASFWHRRHRRRKLTPLQLVSSDIQRRSKKPARIGNTNNSPAITGRNPSSTRQEKNILGVPQRAAETETRDNVSSTISLPGSSCSCLSSSWADSTIDILPGALPSSDDEQMDSGIQTEIHVPTRSTNEATDLINIDRNSHSIRRSRILQTLNTS
ncbi:protocadherin Fat 4-like [Corticium candelabrum]|uniref:protocadherin Fat 4-like n=1 Tax=Corticium candelabrum TaxID=121492 RepID=UPI002E26AC72|nr:protocadherin Fat 4-like [Corticium candelabrum]